MSKDKNLIDHHDQITIRYRKFKLRLHDAIYWLRFYSNSLIHTLLLSYSHNDIASIQKNRGDKSHSVIVTILKSWFLPGIFSRGRGAKSIVMKISFVMLLFSDQISGGGKSLQGGQTASGGALPPCGRKPESQFVIENLSYKEQRDKKVWKITNWNH